MFGASRSAVGVEGLFGESWNDAGGGVQCCFAGDGWGCEGVGGGLEGIPDRPPDDDR